MAIKYGIVIHGGAGTILKSMMTSEQETAYREKLTEAIQAGSDILKNSGTSLDAVQAAINVMEDSPLFNAGKGAVFTNEGENEQDASIMDGLTLDCGAVAGVKRIKNPIDLARTVMEKSEHVLLGCEGAEAFAQRNNFDFADKDYFYTEQRWRQLQLAKRREKEKNAEVTSLDHTPDDKHGTVGAVALDSNGNLAAATSSGGMTNKRFGRIGDSPIIGAGTYANNKTCAISTTGHGEYFIRCVTAYDISAMMEYGGMSLQEASAKAIYDKLTALGGTGGCIGIDRAGNFVMPFNTEGMYRGWCLESGEISVNIFKD